MDTAASKLIIETFNEMTAEKEREFKTQVRTRIASISVLQAGIAKMKDQLAAEQKALREMAHEPQTIESIWKVPQ